MKLKQIPADFKVTEIVKIPKEYLGQYTYFWLEKINYNTTRAIEQIARALAISKRRLHFSGAKDKNAVTKQLVSVIGILPDQLKKINLKDIKIAPLHRGKERVSLGAHKANFFEITIRDLSTNTKPIKFSKSYPNYFDEQRFSSNNAKVGKALLQGFIREAVELILIKNKETEKLVRQQNWKDLIKLYEKPRGEERTIVTHLISDKNDYTGAFRNLHKKVRMLYIHAYQSSLFNKALSKIIAKPALHIIIAEEKLAIGSVKNTELELPGYKTKFKKSKYSETVKKLLKKDGLTLESFKCPRTPELASPGSIRSTVVKPSKLKISKLQNDELNQSKKKITVSFALPKGAYATLFIKLLFQEH